MNVPATWRVFQVYYCLTKTAPENNIPSRSPVITHRNRVALSQPVALMIRASASNH
jgi:hypothetical protein